jgi:PKD repeat protein
MTLTIGKDPATMKVTTWDIFWVLMLVIGIAWLLLPSASAEEPTFAVDFAGNVTNGTAPLLVEFSNLVTGNQVNCTWGIGNEIVDGCPGPVHNFIIPGTYDINLTVTNDANVTLTETKYDYIVVNPAPIPVSLSFISNTVFGSNPVELTDINGTIVFVGNTSSRNMTPMDGHYKLQIEPGGISDAMNSPDYGLTMAANLARKNLLGIFIGGSMLLIIIGYFWRH